ncbi:putative type IX secretion system sortase PorU2 [Neolewinella persica]|uniref:putative type IX secretion system sortase PorU2 n=1 Tax=Neolewinella persica TaxID=70998 RepID=UPI000368E4F6|nr:C25 family cysteine peptidase [Neolewinella persica]
MFRILLTLCIAFFSAFLFAQMPNPDGSVSYGNEWIDYDRNYLVVKVAQDGMYRISPAEIAAAGPFGSGDWVLYHKGQVVPLEETTEGIVFYGERNRGEMDRHFFPDPDADQLNDQYSMHTDTSAYYLSRGADGQNYEARPIVGQIVDRDIILRTSEQVFGDHMSKSFFRSAGSSIYYSHYDKAEGFGSRNTNDLLSPDGRRDNVFPLSLAGSINAEAVLDVRFGTAFDGHIVEIRADGNLLKTVTQSSWSVQQHRVNFTPSGESTEINIEGTRGSRDKPNIAWAKATYSASTAWDEGLNSFIIPSSRTATRIVFTGLGADAGASGEIKSYAPATGDLVSASINMAGEATLEFPASGEDLTWRLVPGENFMTAPASSGLRFSSNLPTDINTNYLIITSRRLNGQAVNELADYRRSVTGGSYVVHTVDVEDLYDEYAYGLGRHPMAIRNYLSAAKLAIPKLQYLFLIGKGREYPDIRTPAQLVRAKETFFIPSFGFPASDNLMAADLGSVIPNYSVGRLAAINEGEVELYLKKLRDVEGQIEQGDQTIADREWMKQIMHLGGGVSPGEQSSIRSRLQRMEDSIRISEMGANVVSFYKSSSEPIEDSRQQAIFDRINNGTSIITFFGHSSSQTFDFSIDDPDNYFNFGKYPYMMSLGCYSGDAFTEARSISERFIFLRDKGAIAFAASKGVGYISALGNWGNILYESMGNVNYGEGIGDAMRTTIAEFAGTSNFTLGILLEQFALSGDPAYRMHPRPGTDLIVDAATISFEPEVVPAQNPNYTISLELVNLGLKPDQESVTLRFRQQLPSGEVVELATHRVAAPDYREAFELELPNIGFSAVGQNRILISIDPENEIVEAPLPAAKSNNELVIGGQAGVPLTIIANTAKAAFPPQYGVIGGALEFVASTTNALAPDRDYIIQVASDRRFRNLLSNETINRPGGIIRYSPGFQPVDSTTYYWRISPDSSFTEGAGFLWSESSFTWLADQPDNEISWALQDPGQTVDGAFENVFADTTELGWGSSRSITDIKIFNAPYQNSTMPRFEFDGQIFFSPFRWRISTGIQVLVIDSTNNRNWYGNPGNGEYGTRPFSGSSWDFDTRRPAERAGLIQFLTEGIEPGKYVLIYTVQRNLSDYYNADWETDSTNLGNTIFNVLEQEGALLTRRMTEVGSVPYAFTYQKGMGPITEIMAESLNDTIAMEASLLSNWPEGKWTSAKAGPALSWKKVNLGLSSLNLTDQDSVGVRIMALSSAGVETEILAQEFDFQASRALSLPLNSVSAEEFPFLWAEFNFYDEDGRTTPTVEYVYFDHEAPGDAAINPQIAYNVPDSIDQGQTLAIAAGYENISRIGMDSILIELEVVNDRNETTTYLKRRPPLPAGATDQFSFDVPTEAFIGPHRFNVTLNPDQDQPEFVLFNNILTSVFKVGEDIIAPSLSVFFDGRRINDGDLVSGKPEIHVQLRDENRYLALNDTAAYFLELSAPDGSRERLSFSDSRIEFLPATTSENTAEIFFRPTLSTNGTYALEVRGRDRTSNAAGRIDFRQEFEVINEQMVANVLTYPNPFTTQTRFVYTLTGNEIPEVFRIQIMTISGRVVRDIDLLAHEELRIGTHQTDFAWDGTDEYGDLLANGVYLYRVITSDSSGSTLEKYDTGTDQFFAREMGKVVILR